MTSILLDFLEVAVHQILYLKDIYPDGIFVETQKYGLPLMQSKHPKVNKYVSDYLRSLRDNYLTNGDGNHLTRLDVVTQINGKDLDTFAFWLSDLELLLELEDAEAPPDSAFVIEIQDKFRSMLLRLNANVEKGFFASAKEQDEELVKHRATSGFIFRIHSYEDSGEKESEQDQDWCVIDNNTVRDSKTPSHNQERELEPIFDFKEPFQMCLAHIKPD